MKLQVNESTAEPISICAKKKWNNTKLEVQAGEKYEFQAIGQWKDFRIPATAEGYNRWYLKPVAWLKRSKKDKWFALMASVDKKKKYYFIGKPDGILMEESGILYCFANDIKTMYWNNKGSIKLKIKRVK